jgi:hypothetical protein
VSQTVYVPLIQSPKDLATSAYDLAKKQVPKPSASFAPATSQGIVQVGTWFWVTGASWQPVTARASIPGLTTTVTATPVTLRFSPGDGKYGTGDVSCTGPGPVWTAPAGDETPSPCQYTYHHASSLSRSGTWPASVSIDWDVRWTATSGEGGSLGSLTTTSAYAMRVGELEAVVVKP